jgi:hypothetical protein
MEASERFDFTDEPTVRLLDGRIVIESLRVEDERAARVVRERAEAGRSPADTVSKAIEIGARVIDSEGAAANVDYVRAEFGRHAGELAERLSKLIDGGNDQLAEEIAKSFGADRQGTVQHQIKEMLDRTAEAQREALSRQFSATDGSNPLHDFKDGVIRALAESRERQQSESEQSRKRIEVLTREIVELKERAGADERVAEAELAGTRKGRSFEERVHDALERIANGRGDVAHRVGDERGLGGSKKGDTVAEIGACDGPPLGRIVFEDKDDQLSKNKAWEELNSAMLERDAEFAVLVVAGEDKIPAGREQLVEYEGNKMIVAVDGEMPDGLGLDLAYRYARLRVLLKREGELELDAPAVRDAAEEARSALKQAQSIRLALTGIDKSSQKARDGLDAMVASVSDRLARIESLISAAD